MPGQGCGKPTYRGMEQYTDKVYSVQGYIVNVTTIPLVLYRCYWEKN